jgi:hypothetical protein
MKLSGSLIQITPVIIEQIVMPLKRVSMSLTSEIIGTWDLAISDINAATSKPIPAPSSPYATNHQTK